MRYSKQQHGFTLLEMVVIVFIIGVVMAIAVVMFAHFNARENLKAKAQHCQSLLNYAHQYAIYTQTPIAFNITPHGYTFSKLGQHNQWQPWRPFANSDGHYRFIRFSWPQSNHLTIKRMRIIFQPDGNISAPIKLPTKMIWWVNGHRTHTTINFTRGGVAP